MLLAVACVHAGMSTSFAAKENQVPRITLYYWFKDPERKRIGRPCIFSKEDEESIQNYLNYMVEHWHGLSSKMLVALAAIIRRKRDKNVKGPCVEWGHNYIK